MVLGRIKTTILGFLVTCTCAGSSHKAFGKYQSGASFGIAPASAGTAVATSSSNTVCVVRSFGDLEACKRSTNIQIGDLQVPAGATLNLNKLIDGTTITLSGIITFGYKEWEGPLVNLDGNRIVLKGKGILDGGGQRWWDGLGKNGRGKTKYVSIVLKSFAD